YFLLGDHYVLVGTGVYDADVVVPVVLVGIVIDRQGRVATGKDRCVHCQIEGGDTIVIGAAVELVITEHKVVRQSRSRVLAHLDLKGGYPRTARIQTFQTYPDGLPTALEGIRWIDGVDACFGIGLVFVIGYRRKIYRVLYAIDRRILYREIKDRLSVAVIVAGDQGVLQGGIGRIGQWHHDQFQLHDGVARKELRR